MWPYHEIWNCSFSNISWIWSAMSKSSKVPLDSPMNFLATMYIISNQSSTSRFLKVGQDLPSLHGIVVMFPLNIFQVHLDYLRVILEVARHSKALLIVNQISKLLWISNSYHLFHQDRHLLI